jgi:TonB family protein
MSKILTRLTLAGLAALPCALTAAAQAGAAQSPAPPADAWVTVSPAGEGFTARMPGQPTAAEQSVRTGDLKASGRRYTFASDDGTTFVVFSMKGDHGATRLGTGEQAGASLPAWMQHLDAVAELGWELLVRPEFERLEREKVSKKRRDELDLGMAYRRELKSGGHPAREYSVNLEGARGSAYLYAEGPQVYVVAALGASAGDPRLKQFLDSFALKTFAASPPPPEGGGVGPGRGGNTGRAGRGGPIGARDDTGFGGGGATIEAPIDYTRPFRQGEVTKKASLTRKPEPGFTEEARRFNVTGVVRLRAILAASGEVQKIVIVRGLPHGLTEKAVAAARKVKFNPAQKDGRVVSQYVIFEYNFNIY